MKEETKYFLRVIVSLKLIKILMKISLDFYIIYLTFELYV